MNLEQQLKDLMGWRPTAPCCGTCQSFQDSPAKDYRCKANVVHLIQTTKDAWCIHHVPKD